MIGRLDGSDERAVADVADLHEEFLPDSPVVLFGRRFLREFYYGTLVRDGLIGCTTGTVDGRVVGFISYAVDPLTFMTEGIKRHPVQLAWILAGSVLRKPSLIGNLILVVRMMWDRRHDAASGAVDGRGEVLSMATRPAYQSHVPEGGRSRLTVRLFEDMMDYYREAGVTRFHFLVAPDNRASNLFCSVMGGRLEVIRQAGLAVHRYLLDVPPAKPVAREPAADRSA